MNHCFQVEVFVDGSCGFDRLFASIEGADRCYDNQLKDLKQEHNARCFIKRGQGIDYEERMHMAVDADGTYIRLTVRKIEP